MALFKRKKEPVTPVDEEPQVFSHSSGATRLGDVLDQHDPQYDAKYDKDNPPPVPRGRASRLFPDDHPVKNPFEVKRK